MAKHERFLQHLFTYAKYIIIGYDLSKYFYQTSCQNNFISYVVIFSFTPSVDNIMLYLKFDLNLWAFKNVFIYLTFYFKTNNMIVAINNDLKRM